ncbi:MAG TPA: hypothetical protein VGP72_10550 [Planctomycetota bacterium]|jgi:hypothetical protein
MKSIIALAMVLTLAALGADKPEEHGDDRMVDRADKPDPASGIERDGTFTGKKPKKKEAEPEADTKVEKTTKKVTKFYLKDKKVVTAARFTNAEGRYSITTLDGDFVAVADDDVEKMEPATIVIETVTTVRDSKPEPKAKAPAKGQTMDELVASLKPLFDDYLRTVQAHEDGIKDANQLWNAQEPAVRKRFTKQVYDSQARQYVDQLDEVQYNAALDTFRVQQTPKLRDLERARKAAEEKLTTERDGIVREAQEKYGKTKAQEDMAYFFRLREAMNRAYRIK